MSAKDYVLGSKKTRKQTRKIVGPLKSASPALLSAKIGSHHLFPTRLLTSEDECKWF
jgi:hypothetical protein